MYLTNEEFLLLSDELKVAYLEYRYGLYFDYLEVGEESVECYGNFINDCYQDTLKYLGVEATNYYNTIEYVVFKRVEKAPKIAVDFESLFEHINNLNQVKNEILENRKEKDEDLTEEERIERDLVAYNIAVLGYNNFEVLTDEEIESLIEARLASYDANTRNIEEESLTNLEYYINYVNNKKTRA